MDEEEVEKDPDADLPTFKVRHSDMNIELIKIVVRSNHLKRLRSGRTVCRRGQETRHLIREKYLHGPRGLPKEG